MTTNYDQKSWSMSPDGTRQQLSPGRTEGLGLVEILVDAAVHQGWSGDDQWVGGDVYSAVHTAEIQRADLDDLAQTVELPLLNDAEWDEFKSTAVYEHWVDDLGFVYVYGHETDEAFEHHREQRAVRWADELHRQIIDHLNQLTPRSLSSLANCYMPDSENSAGAEFLATVCDQFVDWFRYQEAVLLVDGSDLGELISDDGSDHEIADSAPNVYDHRRWAEFVDLGAYREEAELGDWDADLTRAAGQALYQIAHRLVIALVREVEQLVEEAN